MSRPQTSPGLFEGAGVDVEAEDIRGWLGDTADTELPVYRDGTSRKDVLVTIATGLLEKTFKSEAI